MLLERKEAKRERDGLLVIESYFDSTNIAKVNFIPDQRYMFIFFNNGLVYSYSNITEELYRNFEAAESQGKFFISEIKKKPNLYRHVREFKLYEFERQDIMQIIETLKEGKNQDNHNN
jgi:hypothetical protein